MHIASYILVNDRSTIVIVNFTSSRCSIT